jgi:hypothetical protein
MACPKGGETVGREGALGIVVPGLIGVRMIMVMVMVVVMVVWRGVLLFVRTFVGLVSPKVRGCGDMFCAA